MAVSLIGSMSLSPAAMAKDLWELYSAAQRTNGTGKPSGKVGGSKFAQRRRCIAGAAHAICARGCVAVASVCAWLV